VKNECTRSDGGVIVMQRVEQPAACFDSIWMRIDCGGEHPKAKAVAGPETELAEGRLTKPASSIDRNDAGPAPGPPSPSNALVLTPACRTRRTR
jgi:hypothetical protein